MPNPPVHGTSRAIETIVLPTNPTAQFIRLVATQPRTHAAHHRRDERVSLVAERAGAMDARARPC